MGSPPGLVNTGDADELDFALTVARQAGALIRDGLQPVGKQVVQTKADGTPVIRVDREVNQFVTTAVRQQRPGEAVLGEEGGQHGRSKRLQVCDPLDGTWTYTAALSLPVLSLALVIDGYPTGGVVYDPHADRMISAVEGAGAWLNGQRIHVNSDSINGGF
jgi:fructose-1,6-bisphosphatase/inositol monophosphatase family enzyme